MNRIIVCLDCPEYQKGGYCRHKRKDVSALTEACDHAKKMNLMFNPEDKEETMSNPLAPQAQTKTCTKCGRELPISEFYARTGSKDGLQTICKDCHNAATKLCREQAAQRARKALAEKRAAKAQEQPQPTEEQPKTVVVRETLTDKQMVDTLREHGWTVTCYRTITEEL
ncbi:hypothetical protein [Succinimonas sp.]|uniref:hypothetical protein n=1 Tax=Succinimonas sp. TaxID=1936151 RepID=UPI00386F21E2